MPKHTQTYTYMRAGAHTHTQTHPHSKIHPDPYTRLSCLSLFLVAGMEIRVYLLDVCYREQERESTFSHIPDHYNRYKVRDNSVTLPFHLSSSASMTLRTVRLSCPPCPPLFSVCLFRGERGCASVCVCVYLCARVKARERWGLLGVCLCACLSASCLSY